MDPEISLPHLQELVRVSNMSRANTVSCITLCYISLELTSSLRLGVPSGFFNEDLYNVLSHLLGAIRKVEKSGY